ncbi:helix-turn-helix domain-containing protein [Streptomyces sp. B-S-A8]|uniref:Helix-turn-helix domain-containing protein n=1 Tax=Streptomyces solicavernae TaxID=3043614 RepID=A0ABT6RZ95_9ACTN|nr:helix-turn-helix domain-containing protein [Streptomyces sp. B-S-A8]MDI3389755.1 helix-turn-helix domain-containing protein [Streptomyces sp. B-S-A8]
MAKKSSTTGTGPVTDSGTGPGTDETAPASVELRRAAARQARRSSQGEPRTIEDLATLKALGHPLRMKLYRALYVAETATASQLAATVDEAVSLVSYHLRKLAEHGLIEDADTPGGDGRERWWRTASDGVRTRERDFTDAPEKVVAHSALSRLSLEQRGELYRDFIAAGPAWDEEWRSASFSSEAFTRMTVEELRQLSNELHAVVQRHKDQALAAEEAGRTAGREHVAVHFYGFPFRP